MIALGALLAPVAILSGWAVSQLTDTDRFVATFAPLGADDEVQSYLASTVSKAIEEHVDFPSLVDPFIDGLAGDVGLSETYAVDAVKGLVQQGARQLLGTAVSTVVESDTFSALFEQSLRVSHGVLIRALTDNGTVMSVADDGTIGVELGPIVESVKSSLVDGGLGFAAAIPEVHHTVPIATSQALVQLRSAYAVATAIGGWLPWVVVSLVLGGLIVVGGGIRSVIGSAAGIAASAAVLLIGTGIGRLVALRELDALGLPPTVAAHVFDRAIGDIVMAASWVLGFALIVAVVCWLVAVATQWWVGRRATANPA